jgi:hypothetical protein
METRGELDTGPSPRHGDHTVFERLAQSVEMSARKLG